MSSFSFSGLKTIKCGQNSCYPSLISHMNNYYFFKVLGQHLFLRLKKQEPLFSGNNYILKIYMIVVSPCYSSGNWHAPNLTVPDSSICPIADQTLLLCFYSLCIIQGLNTDHYEKGGKKTVLRVQQSAAFKLPCSSSPCRHPWWELKYLAASSLIQEPLAPCSCRFSENPSKHQALSKPCKPNLQNPVQWLITLAALP